MVRANAPTLETGYTCAVDPLANNETMLANREESIYAIWRAFRGENGWEGAPVLETVLTKLPGNTRGRNLTDLSLSNISSQLYDVE